jgi:hypothetical protein
MSRSRLIFGVIIFFLLTFTAGQLALAQGVTTMTLTAASVTDLPVRTETYMAVSHTFTWTFDWDNVWTQAPLAVVRPQVVTSSMGYVEVRNNRFGNGHHQWTGGPVSTGYPSDYMEITGDCGSPCNTITNMVFKVTYLDNPTPQSPGGN